MKSFLEMVSSIYQAMCIIVLSLIIIAGIVLHELGAFDDFHFQEQMRVMNPPGDVRASIVYEGPWEEGRLVYYASGLHVIAAGEKISPFNRWLRGYGLRPATEVARGRYFGPEVKKGEKQLLWLTPMTLEFRYCSGTIYEFRNFIEVKFKNGERRRIEIRLRKECNDR